ncbi:MAG: MarR family transcriptional regulator, partial [Calditrichaeota bacterium]
MSVEENIAMVLRAAYLSMHRQTNTFLSKSGVTADQFVCLVILDDEDGITQQELATRATSDPNTISAMLALLEKQNLV